MKTILFVDDDPAILASMRRLLRRKQEVWNALFALGGHEATHLLTTEKVDAVVTDVSMPGITGLELLQHIVEGPYGFIPVIVVTGIQDRDAKRKAIEIGAQDLLTKPVDYEDLVARLHSVLKLKEYHDELTCRNAQLEDLVAARTEELAASRLELVLQLSKAAELRDQETGHHVLRVGMFARAIAMEYGFTEEEGDELFLASTLHDIGKIGVPDAILLKPGKLQASERKIIEGHCRIGHQILNTRDSMLNRIMPAAIKKTEQPKMLKLAAEIARSHHEYWDGTGYPDGLKGEEIPVAARIVAMADVLDALRSTRPYKPQFSWEKCVLSIASERGTHFDPAVHDAFLEAEPVLREFDHIAREDDDTYFLAVAA